MNRLKCLPAEDEFGAGQHGLVGKLRYVDLLCLVIFALVPDLCYYHAWLFRYLRRLVNFSWRLRLSFFDRQSSYRSPTFQLPTMQATSTSDVSHHHCLWQGCGKHFKNSVGLSSHIICHLNEKDLVEGKFVCLWEGCNQHLEWIRKNCLVHLQSTSCSSFFE